MWARARTGVGAPQYLPMDLAAFSYLTLGGGAMHGLMYPGALAAAAGHSPTTWQAWFETRLEGLAGASMGALMAVLLAVWDPWRVGAYLRSTAFDRITRELSRQTVRDMSATRALSNGLELEDLLRQGVAEAYGDPDLTLARLQARTGKRVLVTVTNLSTGGPEYWGGPTGPPDVPVWLALRASVSLPGVFPPVSLGGSLYCDGGVTCNVPCHLWPPGRTLTLYVATGNRPRALASLPALLLRMWDAYSSGAQLGALRGQPGYLWGAVPCLASEGGPSLYDFSVGRQGVEALLTQGALCWEAAACLRRLWRLAAATAACGPGTPATAGAQAPGTAPPAAPTPSTPAGPAPPCGLPPPTGPA